MLFPLFRMKNQITTLVLCLSVALYHAVPLEVEWARQMNGTDYNMTDGNWSMFRQDFNFTDGGFNYTMGNWTRQDLNETMGTMGNWTDGFGTYPTDGTMGNWTLGTVGTLNITDGMVNWINETYGTLPTDGTY